jgi:hypothetical protein
MKAIYYILFLLLYPATAALAQLDGKRFISGSASTNFFATNPETGKSTNSYAYGVNLGRGKFKTATRVGEWSIFSNMTGSKQNITGATDTITVSGINVFSIGTGYSWSFYKHFNDKFGVFGGPGVSVKYDFGKQTQGSGDNLYDYKSNEISASLQLSAGAYYILNDRWWLTASLAFSNPVYLAYTFGSSERRATGEGTDNTGLKYQLAPSFTFPSVGLGLRYFFKD